MQNSDSERTTRSDPSADGSEASSAISAALDPRFPVWHARFASSGPTRIVLKETNRFHDADGNVLFNLQFKTLTASGRILIEDADGAPVGHVRRKRRPSARATYYFGTEMCEKVGTVVARATRPRPGECDAEIYLGEALVGETIGNWFKKSFFVYFGGLQVAEAFRRPSCAEGGFCVEIVCEGVDASFVVMVVLALGEIYDWADSCNGGVCSNILTGRGLLSRSTMSSCSDEDGSDSFRLHT